MSFLFEPEYALAALERRPLPPVTALGEQYAVAALLYRLFTGSHYADFSLTSSELNSQIARDPPLSFNARGEEAWPELEACLSRALSKAPRDRYASTIPPSQAISTLAPHPRSSRAQTGRDLASQRRVVNHLDCRVYANESAYRL